MNFQCMLITQLIQRGSVLKYDHHIKSELFTHTNREIYEFIRNYEQQHGECMNEASFKAQFDGMFVWTPTGLDVLFIISAWEEAHIAAAAKKIMADSVAVVEDDPLKILTQSITELQKLAANHSAKEKAVDIVAGIRQRREFYASQQIVGGLSGVTMGFDHFDELTHGTQPGEIEFWVARPANLKTYSLLWTAHQARLQGKRVSFISPEMDEAEIGLRLDAIMLQISLTMLKSRRTDTEFFRVFDEAMEEVLHAGTFGKILFHEAFNSGKRFTVGDVRQVIEADEPDIVIIDGLLFIDPVNKGRDLRENIGTLMAEFRQLTNKTRVPLRLAHQASRLADRPVTGKRKKDITAVDRIPELDHLAESAATEQFANRVICMCYSKEEKRVYYATRKDRSAEAGGIIFSYVNPDTGTFSKSHTYVADDDDAQLGFGDSPEDTF